MAFNFRFEFLLNHRLRLEEMAQKDYMEAKAKLDDCLAGIQKMYTSIDESRGRIAQMQKDGQSVICRIQEEELFMAGQAVRIDRERQKARELMIVAEEKQELLLEAAKNRKMIEVLKDKKAQAYKKDMRLREAKQLDDLVVMRQARKERS